MTMSNEQKYTIQGLDEYIRQGEPRKRERSEAWKVAINNFSTIEQMKDCNLENTSIISTSTQFR